MRSAWAGLALGRGLWEGGGGEAVASGGGGIEWDSKREEGIIMAMAMEE